MEEEKSKKFYVYYALFVLFKRKWFIVGFVLFFFLAIFAYSFLTTPLWEASAKVLVDYNPKQQIIIFSDVNIPIAGKPEANPVNDLVTILTGQEMAKEIVQRFGRDEMLRQRRENPETVADSIKKFIRDVLIETPKNILASLGVIELKPENYVYDAIDEFIEDRQNIEVEEDTNIINVAVYGETPKLARDMANELAALLIERMRDLNQKSITQAYVYAAEQKNLAEKELEKAEARLETFRKDNNLVELDQQVQLNLIRLNELEADNNRAVSEQKATRRRLEELESHIDQTNQKLVGPTSVIDNPSVVLLRNNLDDLELELASMLTYMKENHPDVIKAKARIQEAKEKLKHAAEFILDSRAVPINEHMENMLNQLVNNILLDAELSARLEVLRQQIAGNKQEGRRLLEQQLTETRLMREVKLQEGIYDSLKNKMLEFEALQRIPFGNFDLKVVDPAYVFDDQDPDWPMWVVNLFVAIVGGFFIAIAGAFVLEFFAYGCRTVEETEQITKLPVIAVVGQFSRGSRILPDRLS